MLSGQRGPLLRLNTVETKPPPSSLRAVVHPDVQTATQTKNSRLSISVFRYVLVLHIDAYDQR